MIALLQRRARRRFLAGISAPAELEQYVETARPEYFLAARRAAAGKRREIEHVLDALGIDVRGAAFLDIGAGYGETLAVCHERGARSVTFVDWDPVFLAHNRLRRLGEGFELDVLKELPRLPAAAYDLVWSKGCVWADFFLRGRMRAFDRWLGELEALASPRGTIVLCPYWEQAHGAPRVADPVASPFSEALRRRGWEVHTDLAEHNSPSYPVTYVRRRR